MKRFAIAFLCVAASIGCSGKSKKSTSTPGAGSGSGSAIYAKKFLVAFAITPNDAGTAADVFLQTTDETGKQVSHPLGTFQGTCIVFTPAEQMKAVTGVQCLSNGSGTELDAVVQGTDVIVLKAAVQNGATPDPMAREELTRVQAPAGSAVEIAPSP